MPNSSLSLADLQQRITSTPQAVFLVLLTLEHNDYDGWVRCIHQLLAWIAKEFAQNPELRTGLSEDEITIQVVSHLRQAGFAADHETKVGGHCDIKISGSFEKHWLAEAKIKGGTSKYDYRWLLKGVNQLLNRYSTGEIGQNHGGFLIYCKQSHIDDVMRQWKKKLVQELEGSDFLPCEWGTAGFRSTLLHKRTGRSYSVQHIPFNLYFGPTA